MPIVPGTRVGPYAIVSPLGAGGMGEVYRARDTRLQRDVALKTLPAALASDTIHVERFRREARAVAALTHPNIVTIHSVEEADGVHFLTMELIEGRSLDREFPPTGYPLPQLIEIGMALADGLAAAHERGIVHRDLKPANVMIDREGRVKILDFGLAKDTAIDVAQAETLAPLTNAGLVVGTMPYMAPEQIEGRTVDARADIFALGIVLYELATGARPFAGESSAMLMTTILRDEPRPVAERRPDLPAAFGRLVSRCLAKRPNDRIQTARDVYNELRALRGETNAATAMPIGGQAAVAPTRPTPSSGAERATGLWTTVLPFTARGADPDLIALAEGLTEDVTAGLIKFPYLKIVAASGSERPARARFVVQGSLRRAGSMLRVAVELIDSESGVHLWADRFDREFTPARIFEIQDDLAGRIIVNVGDNNGALVRAMAATVHDRVMSSLTIDELICRALAGEHRGDPAENARLIEALEAALTCDSSHAEGWAGLAQLCGRAYLDPTTGIADAVPRQRAAARRAIDIDPTNQRGWCELATAAFYDRDAPAFRSAADRALALNPLNANVVAFLSHLIAYSGDWPRGIEMLERTMAIAGQHPGWYHFMPFVNHFRLGEYERAWEVIKRVNMTEYPWMLLSLAMASVRLERWDDARAAVSTIRRVAPRFVNANNVAIELRKLLWDDAIVEQELAAFRDALICEERGSVTRTSVPSSSARTMAPRQSIAVLPFANLSADPENEYFGDGLAEEILNALTAIRGLTVIARTSAFAFKGKSDDVRKIGETLGVGTVLEGSVRRQGGRVRVTAQLVETASGTHLWSQRYDREMTDIFVVQDDMAQAIAVALRGTLAPSAQARRYTPGVPAYEAFLKGRAQLIHFTPDAWQRARAYFDEAIALDAEYADPHAELALGHFIRGMHGMAAMREVAPFVRAGATRALELEPSNPQPRVVLGGLALAHDYDWDAARAHFAASMQSPNVPAHARWIYGSLYLHALGRFDESSTEMTRAVEQDPLNATWHGILAAHLAHAGRSNEALAAAMRARELEPNYYVSLHVLGEVLEAAGRYAEALDAYQQAHALAPWFAINAGCLASALRRAGRREESDRVLAEMGPTPRPMFGRVLYDLRVGAIDAAADSYERMIAERDPFALVFANSHNTRPLREDPRWPALAGKMNLPKMEDAGTPFDIIGGRKGG